jgi:hypothetical protein
LETLIKTRKVIRLAGLGQHFNWDVPYLSINPPLISKVVNNRQKISSKARRVGQDEQTDKEI